MPDENAGGAASVAAPAERNPTNPEGDAGMQNPNSPEAGNNPVENAKNTGAENMGDNAEGAEEVFEDDGKEPEVATRKTAKDFIIERQQRKIAKMQGQNGNGEYDEGNGGDSGQEGEQFGEPNDGAGKAEENNQEAQFNAMQPIIEQHLADQDAQEVTAFLEENPDFTPFAGKVERLMKHPSRRQIPVSAIFYEVAGQQLLKMGADRARKADAEARGTQSGGDSNREGTAPIDWSSATPEQVAAEKQRLRERANY